MSKRVPYDSAQLKPGRRFCHCQARVHRLVRNCLKCGRVACEQEGSGPCFNCGNLVCTREERKILDENTKKSFDLMKRLMNNGSASTSLENTDQLNSFAQLSSSIIQAYEYKEKLLAADKSRDRTKVNDLEADYYNLENNAFLSPEDREAIIKRKEELRQLNMQNQRRAVVDLDLTNMIATENKHRSLEIVDDPILQTILTSSKQSVRTMNENNISDSADIFKGFVPRYCADLSVVHIQNDVALQDVLQLIEKNGRNTVHCIALIEPMASFVASGRRSHLPCRCEISQRGPVLIASFEHEDYQLFYFPYEAGTDKVTSSQIPSILGRGIIRDCLTWAEYNEEFPDGECSGVSDNFVLILEMQEPVSMLIPHFSPSEFYEVERALGRNLHSEGIFESCDLNLL